MVLKLRFPFFLSSYCSGGYRSRYEYVDDMALACVRVGCCDPGPMIIPEPSTLEFFDEIQIEPERFLEFTDRNAVKDLACGLRSQKMIINLEVSYGDLVLLEFRLTDSILLECSF
jgi:hypothetical protein